MTASRRLSKLESSLTPTQLVVRWLDDAHAHGSFVDYGRALLDVEPDDLPINRLAREARRSALSALTSHRRDEEAKAVAKALRETLFRFFLVLRINVTTHEQMEKEIYIEAATASMVALLVEQDRDVDDYDHRLGHACLVMMTRVADLEALAAARRLAAERYLDGREALFPAEVATWDDQLNGARERAGMALRLAELDGVAVDEPDRTWAEDRVDARLADLVEPARATALEKVGEGERGLAIVTGWLRTKLNSDVPDEEHRGGVIGDAHEGGERPAHNQQP